MVNLTVKRKEDSVSSISHRCSTELRSEEFGGQHLKRFAEPIQFCVRGFTLLKEATAIGKKCFCFVTMLRQVVYVKVSPKFQSNTLLKASHLPSCPSASWCHALL